ncbi:probable inactive poly [ADP-ribose] polymerase SRO3 [Phalaenopsis equestris]|uniref:probable inactive poly [ADP-ribose] polymerase SRO3 n=1 Tax=Phalaenopsis equestris TaxID=78828 RepID=UPI0009E4839A|nr:probable inactive poly [ADP-ribose] polymerase SRO3 [Phalaenopsis equestris]
MFAVQSSNLSDAVFSPDQLVRAFNNFKKSGMPSRFLIFSGDAWVDFAHQVFDELKAGFLAGKTIFEATVDQKSYLFDFLRLIRIDSETGRQHLIAWIDVHGRHFFPKIALDDNSNLLFKSSPQLHHPLVAKKADIYEENMEVSSDRWPGAKMLRDDDKFYKVVEKLFLSGIKRFIVNTLITSINRCSHSTVAGNSRLLSFKVHKSATMESRGNANVKFGWYGTSAGDIAAIMTNGFKQSNSNKLGLAAHGVGNHLSPPHFPYGSALMSEADEDGERHVILCRVIMGNSEKVEAGSTMDHPSDERFDSGVDNIENPKWFVVWNSRMNTHIIPEYIVSFKSSGHSQGWRRPVGMQKLSSVMNLPFWKLFAEIGKSLPASKMHALEIFYNQYNVGKISKEIFIRYMRSIAGDKLLISSIKSLKG